MKRKEYNDLWREIRKPLKANPKKYAPKYNVTEDYMWYILDILDNLEDRINDEPMSVDEYYYLQWCVDNIIKDIYKRVHYSKRQNVQITQVRYGQYLILKFYRGLLNNKVKRGEELSPEEKKILTSSQPY